MSSDYISFPNLHLTFNVSPDIVTFNLFGQPFSLKWYGLLIAVGFLLAVVYAIRRAKDFDIDPDRMIDVVLVSTIFAFIGARLYFVLFSNDTSYLENPITILQVWNGGLAIYGGIIFAFVTAIWMCRVRKVNTLAMFDLASLGFLIGQCIGRWGNFFNQEAYGGNTPDGYLLGMTGSLIKTGVNATSTYTLTKLVHPTFLYESVWCLIGFILLHLVSKKAYKFKGEIFSLYVMWYGLGRFFIEGLRIDSLKFGEMRISQIVAILSVIGGGVLFLLLRAHHDASPKDLFAAETAEGGTVPLNEETGDDESLPTEEEKDAEEAPAESADSSDESDKPDESEDSGEADSSESTDTAPDDGGEPGTDSETDAESGPETDSKAE